MTWAGHNMAEYDDEELREMRRDWALHQEDEAERLDEAAVERDRMERAMGHAQDTTEWCMALRCHKQAFEECGMCGARTCEVHSEHPHTRSDPAT